MLTHATHVLAPLRVSLRSRGCLLPPRAAPDAVEASTASPVAPPPKEKQTAPKEKQAEPKEKTKETADKEKVRAKEAVESHPLVPSFWNRVQQLEPVEELKKANPFQVAGSAAFICVLIAAIAQLRRLNAILQEPEEARPQALGTAESGAPLTPRSQRTSQVDIQQASNGAVVDERSPARPSSLGEASTSERGGPSNSSSEPPVEAWWQMDELFLLTRVSESPSPADFILLPTKDDRLLLPTCKTADGAQCLRAAWLKWLESYPDFAGIEANGRAGEDLIRISVMEPRKMPLQNVPDIVVVPESILTQDLLEFPLQWRRILRAAVDEQLVAWDAYRESAAQATRSPSTAASPPEARPQSQPASPAGSIGPPPPPTPSSSEATKTPPDTGKAPSPEELRVLTEAEADRTLLHPNVDDLDVIYAPMLLTTGSDNDRMLLTIDVSLDPEELDIIAIVFEDPHDAQALLAMLAFTAGFTDAEQVQRRVIPMPPSVAADSAAVQTASLVCLRKGFRTKASMKVGASIDQVTRTIAGARWASLVEPQLEAANSSTS